MNGRWALSPAGDKYLHEKGLSDQSPLVSLTLGKLEKHIDEIEDLLRKSFADEAVECFNRGLKRASVVLTWVGAMWIIQEHIFKNVLQKFNAAGLSRFSKTFKPVNAMEHFPRLQEVDILQLSEDIGMIDKNFKKLLGQQLDLRNTCGHPNKIVVDEHTVAHHIEFLLNNVYKKF